MKGQDILLLFKLIELEKQGAGPAAYAMRALADHTGIGKSEVSQSIRRSLFSGLLIRKQNRELSVNTRAFFDFCVHGLKYIFPAKPGPLTRGVLTGFSSPIMCEHLASLARHGYVWPWAEGEALGETIEPLFHSIPRISQSEPFLYDCLALLDSIRTGKAREVNLALELLKKKVINHV